MSSTNPNRRMNEKQRAVAGTVAIAFLVAAFFYVPWRIESSGDLTWAPFYRNPVIGRSTLIAESVDTQFVRLKGQPVWGLYVFQLAMIAAAGVTVFWYVRDVES